MPGDLSAEFGELYPSEALVLNEHSDVISDLMLRVNALERINRELRRAISALETLRQEKN